MNFSPCGIINKLRRRPFPTSWLALKHCRVSYSQNAEDLLLTAELGYERTEGFYVDIGCHHPVMFSNTYIFYQRGWRGLCIDANAGYRAAWQRYRPGDKFICAGVSAQAGRCYYLKFDQYPACNRLVSTSDLEKEKAERRPDSCEEIITQPSAMIIDTHCSGLRAVDLLCVDCEGFDLEILRGWDFERWGPRVICAEDTSFDRQTEMVHYLGDRSYECVAQMGPSKIFRRKDGTD